MLRERASQAAADLAFLSDLEQACQLEVATLCTSKPGHAVTSHLDGAQVIDCLADHRCVQVSQLSSPLLAAKCCRYRVPVTCTMSCCACVIFLRFLFLRACRNAPEFGKECRKQLLAHLQDATSDVRMLHTLHKDCRDDINK